MSYIRFVSIYLFIMPAFFGCGGASNSNAVPPSKPIANTESSAKTDIEIASDLTKMGIHQAAIPILLDTLTKSKDAKEKTEALLLLGTCYLKLEQFDKARDTFDELIKLSPMDPRNYAHKSVACRLMGDFENAEKTLSTALAFAPNDSGTLGAMGALKMFQKAYADAIPYLEQAVKIDGKNAMWRSNLVVAYANQNRFPEAEAQLKILSQAGNKTDRLRNVIDERKAAAN